MAGNDKKSLKFWFPAIMYAMLIFWGSSQEQPFGIKLEVVGLDKIAHIAEYAVFGFLVARAVLGSSGKIPAVTLVFMAFIIGTLYGITDEFHQYFTPSRAVSFLDLLSDSIGSFLGALMFVAFTKDKAILHG
jgi:VanZ family protein